MVEQSNVARPVYETNNLKFFRDKDIVWLDGVLVCSAILVLEQATGRPEGISQCSAGAHLAVICGIC